MWDVERSRNHGGGSWDINITCGIDETCIVVVIDGGQAMETCGWGYAGCMIGRDMEVDSKEAVVANLDVEVGHA